MLVILIKIVTQTTTSVKALPAYEYQVNVSIEDYSKESEALTIPNELDVKYRNKIEETILAIAKEITSENTILGNSAEVSSTPFGYINNLVYSTHATPILYNTY